MSSVTSLAHYDHPPTDAAGNHDRIFVRNRPLLLAAAITACSVSDNPPLLLEALLTAVREQRDCEPDSQVSTGFDRYR